MKKALPTYVYVLLIFLGSLNLFWIKVHFRNLNDDAYITYRYANNIAEGKGFVYNEGEKAQGTTTPLYTLVLALGAKIGFAPPHFSTVLETLGWIGIFLLVALLCAELKRPVVGVVALLILITDYHNIVLCRGMEAPLYTACILLVLYLIVKNHFLSASFMLGILLTFRIDATLLLPVFFLSMYTRRPLVNSQTHSIERKTVILWLKCAVLFLIPVACWYGFALFYFGSLLPNSVYAKIRQAHLGWPTYGQFIIRDYFHFTGVPILWGWFILIGFLLGLRKELKKLRPLWLWAALYCAVLCGTRAPHYPWYHTPLLAPIALMGGIATEAVLQLTLYTVRNARTIRFHVLRYSYRILVILITITLLYLVYFPHIVFAEGYVQHILCQSPYLDTEKGYVPIAAWINDHIPEDAVLASIEIGILGYFTNRQILDIAGLTTPKTLPYFGRQPIDVTLRRFKPDYFAVVLQEGENDDYMKRLPEAAIVYEWINRDYNDSLCRVYQLSWMQKKDTIHDVSNPHR